MDQTRVLVIKIVSMFLVILFGWLARRRAWLDAPMTSMLSRFTTDITLPSLVFSQILATVNRSVIRTAWPIPLMTMVILLLGQLIGIASWRFFARREQARTVISVVMLANWIYLPLPIAQALWHEEGVRTILLCNVGAQIVIWTIGVATLQGGRFRFGSLVNIVFNPGIVATAGSIALAVFAPQVSKRAMVQPVIEAISMIGSLTIPLSLLATGAQLAGVARHHGSGRALTGIITLRLLVVPLVALLAFWSLRHTAWRLPHVQTMCGLLIAAMPVAISGSILCHRYNQDVDLAAQSIFYTTLLSIASVPAMFWLAEQLLR